LETPKRNADHTLISHVKRGVAPLSSANACSTRTGARFIQRVGAGRRERDAAVKAEGHGFDRLSCTLFHSVRCVL